MSGPEVGAEFTDPLEALGHLEWEGDPSSDRRCAVCSRLHEEHYALVPLGLQRAIVRLMRDAVQHLEGPEGEVTTLSARAEAFADALEATD